MHHQRIIALSFVFLTVVGAVSQGLDRVYPKQGVPASGKIKSMSRDEVTITVRGKDQKYQVADIRKITFDGEPRALDRAREQVLMEQYDQALDELKKIAVDSIENPLARQDVEFYRWYSEGKLGLAGSGDKAAAIKGLLHLASTNPKTYHLYDLSELLGELAMAVGQPDKARSYFGLLSKAPSPEMKAAAAYHLGEVELSLGKPAEAKKYFTQLMAGSSNSPEMLRLKSFAQIGLAICESMEGKSEQAIAKLEKMIESSDSTDQGLFARLNNALGACYLALKQPKKALLRYLETDLLFFTEADAHAEALYNLSKLWPEVGNAARAAEARERLVKQYASSRWASKQ